MAGVDESRLLTSAVLASDPATQDPLDMAILAEARRRDLKTPKRLDFVPFDPATKRSQATFVDDGQTVAAIKGAPQVIAALTHAADSEWVDTVQKLSAHGERVLAVAGGPPAEPKLLGFLALADPPRPEASQVIAQLQGLGVRVRMLTGDSIPTATAMANRLGIPGPVCDGSALKSSSEPCGVYAGVFPEDKFHIVQALQKRHRVTGMTGDGVNDAPALKQAEVGIAVANATDVAKAAASLVLTRPGLADVVTAVTVGRQVYQRLLTYTLNKIVKTFQVAMFLSLGLLAFGQFVVTPLMVLLLLFANDFVTMSLSQDRVRYSSSPNRWVLATLIGHATVLAVGWLVYIFGVFWVGRYLLHWPLAEVQSLDFLGLVFSGLANVFLVRETSWFWASRPGRYLLIASAGDIVAVSLLAYAGLGMHPLASGAIAFLLVATLAYVVVLDAVKVQLLPMWHRMGRKAVQMA
jgi:H+-transporting ATPase